MTDPYLHNREFFGAVSGNYRILAGDTGLIVLVPTIPAHTIFIQKLHIEVTTPTGAELWTFQDGAAIPLVPAVSAAAIAHFDFDFGPDGVPCTQATAFVLNITGAVGAIGWITWEGFKKLTLGTAPIVGGAPTAADTGNQTIPNLTVPGTIIANDIKTNTLSVGPVTTPFPVVFRVMGASANLADFQAPGLTAFVYLSPTGGDRWAFGAGAVLPDDFGFSDNTRGYTPVLISGGAAGGQTLLTSLAGVQLQFSGRSNAFPALKAVGATLAVRLANDSADANLSAASVRGTAVAFAALPAAPVEGMLCGVTDSTVNTWGSIIAGGGANHVLAYYNGTNWTVAGK